MEDLVDFFTMTINHRLKIYLGKITQCLSFMEKFAHLQLKYAQLIIICQLI